MAAGQHEEISALFEKLDSLIQGYQFKKALKACADILKRSPKDVDALNTQACLLVETGQFAEALVFLKKHKEVEKQLAYEKAYALYRLSRYEEALAELAGVPDDRLEAKLQLQAQVQYRLGRGEDAYSTYRRLMSELQVSSPEVLTNRVAAGLLAGQSGEAVDLVADPSGGAWRAAAAAQAKPSFEAVFNRACCLLQEGRAEEAEEQLQLAQRLGQEALLEEGLNESEVDAELAPITAQLAYTYSMLGRPSEAVAGYSALLALPDVQDEVVVGVARNNLFAERLAGHAHKKLVADALKRLETLMDKADKHKLKPDLDKRLTDPQRRVLLSNHALLLLLSGRGDACRSALAALQHRFPGSLSLEVLRAAALAQESKLSDADAVLAAAGALSPDALVPTTLMRAQLAASSGNLAAASDLLAQLGAGPLQHRPAVVASLVGLQMKQGDLAGAEKLLQQALDHWRAAKPGPVSSPEGREQALEWLLQQAAALRLKSGDVDGAATHFNELQKMTGGLSSGGARVLSHLARAMALSEEPAGAVVLEKQLPQQGGGGTRDAAQLENAALGEGMRRQVTGLLRKPGPEEMELDPSSAQAATSAAKGAGRKRKRRNKKTKLPKGVDPENPGRAPDPERWLPKWQRSDFKKKRTSRARGKDVVKGSQGAGKVDESLDINSAAAQAKAASKAAAGPSLPAKPAGAKKGKKGRR